MIEKGTVILDIDEYNRLRRLEEKHEKLLDCILEYDEEDNEFKTGCGIYLSKPKYITINKELLKDLLDTYVDDIRFD